MQVIPSINFSDENSVREILPKLQILKGEGVRTLHVDVSDGKFTKASTPLAPGFFDSLLGGDFEFEIHLMVQYPLEYMGKWSSVKSVKRFIVHVESDFNFDEVKDFCSRRGAELELTMNPDGAVKDLMDMTELGNLKRVQFLAVPPGFSGQKLDLSVLEKAKLFKSVYPSVDVFIDGGVDGGTIGKMKEAGASGVVTGSYLWKNEDVKRAYESLAEA